VTASKKDNTNNERLGRRGLLSKIPHLSGHRFSVVEQKMLLLLAVLTLDVRRPTVVHVVQLNLRLGALAEAEKTLQNTGSC